MTKTGDISFLSANHGGFCNSNVATVILNNNKAERNLNLSNTINDFPNLVIDGNSKIILTGNGTLTVHGNLTIKHGVKLVCGTGNKVLVEGDLIIEDQGDLQLGTNASDIFDVRGKVIVNAGGKITQGGCQVNLWNGIENNGTIEIKGGKVTFCGPSGLESNVEVKGTGTTQLGSSIHIKKSAANCHVIFNHRVTTAGGKTCLDLSAGRLTLNYNSGTATDLVQYQVNNEACNFTIPQTAELNIKSTGVFNFFIKSLGEHMNSLLVARAFNVTGATVNVRDDKNTKYRPIVYSTSVDMTFDEAEINTLAITPDAEGSAIDFNTIGATKINCKKAADGEMIPGYFGVFDIRNGIVDMMGQTVVTIEGIARESETKPSLYFNPESSSVAKGMTIHVKTDCTSKVNTLADANECHFGIEAHDALGNLIIATPYAKVQNVDLVLNGGLDIHQDCEIEAAEHNVTIGGDLDIFKGTYTIDPGQTTTFNGTETQLFKNQGTQSLNNVVVESAELKLTALFEVKENFYLNKGKVTIDASKKLCVYEDATIKDGTSIVGDGTFVMGEGTKSTEPSNFFCEGEIDNLEIDDIMGVNAHLTQTTPIYIGKSLTLTRGVFDIAANLIELKGNADIKGTGFGPTKMISTNGSFTDNGVMLTWTKGETKNFTVPLGKISKGLYTPVILSNVVASAAGTLCIATNDEKHPELVEFLKKPQNAGKKLLPYYWVFVGKDLQTSSGNITFEFPGTYTDFVSASYLMSKNTWEIGTEILSNTSNKLKITCDATDKLGYSGEYSACTQGFVVEHDKVYVSAKDGNWADAIWYKVSIVDNGNGSYSFGDYEKELDGVTPKLFSNPMCAGVVVDHHVTVDKTGLRERYAYINLGAILEFTETAKNNIIAIIQGQGTLKVNSEASIPSGRYAEFFKVDGGIIEYAGTGNYNIFGQQATANNVNFTGSGKRYLRTDVDVKSLGWVSVDGPEVVMQNGRNFILDSHMYYTGNVSTTPMGNTLNLASGSITGSGAFELRDCSYTTRVLANGNSNKPEYTNVNTTSPAHNVAVAASFPQVPGLTLENTNGAKVNGNIKLRNLTLANGILDMGNNTVTLGEGGIITGGSEKAYIDGRLAIVNPVSGQEKRYPLGDNNQYASTVFRPEPVGSGTWAIRYMAEDPVTIHSQNPQPDLLGDYWVVESPNANDKAVITLRWERETFATNGVIMSRTTGDWVKLGHDQRRGNTSRGTVRTLRHAVGGTRYYALSGEKVDKDFIWTGSNDDKWDSNYNWLYGLVPTKTADVIIPSGRQKYPTITGKAMASTIDIANGAELTFGLGATVTIESDVTNAGAIVAESGTASFKGAIDNSGTMTLKGTDIVAAQLLNNSGTVDMTKGTLTAHGGITNSGTMTLKGHGATIQVPATGTFTNEGNLTIRYKYNENPNFYLVNDMEGSKRGAVNVERWILGQQYYYVGSATKERKVKGNSDFFAYYFPQGTRDLYQQAGRKDIDITNDGYTQTAFDGITLHGSAEGNDMLKSASVIGSNAAPVVNGKYNYSTFTQTGTLHNASAVETTIPSTASDDNWWTWLSMPYPYTVNINQIKMGDDGSHMTTIYVRGREAQYHIPLGGFYTYNMTTGISVNGEGTTKGASGSIYTLAPFQAFCVDNNTGENLKVSVSPGMASLPAKLKSATLNGDEEPNVLRISTRNSVNTFTDEVAIALHEEGQTFFTAADSRKMAGSGAAEIAVLKDGVPCAIALYPWFYSVDDQYTMPLSVRGNKTGLTLVLENNGFDEMVDIYLRDNRQPDELINLREQTTYVVPNPNEVVDGTLEIVLGVSSEYEEPTGEIDTIVDESIRISSVDNIVTVEVDDVAADANVKIYNLAGQMVAVKSIYGETTNISIATNGIYVVVVQNGNDGQSKKVLLKK
ncbi:MAG: T9SS type A sorting domain-containing protein [Bacteroidia bacterium]|nr:T9SS type A sorting domain-containing protein [Bacteroidia bacterium]